MNSIGFVWDIKDTNWNEMFNKVKEYQSNFGNLNIPSVGEYSKLYNWVSNQLSRFESLSEDRKEKLKELNIDSFSNNKKKLRKFDEWIELYKVYKKQYPEHKTVIKNIDADLNAWCNRMRKLNNQNKLADKKKQRLDELNFVWKINNFNK